MLKTSFWVVFCLLILVSSQVPTHSTAPTLIAHGPMVPPDPWECCGPPDPPPPPPPPPPTYPGNPPGCQDCVGSDSVHHGKIIVKPTKKS